MDLTERLLAAGVLAISIALLARLLLGPRRRQRLDRAAQRAVAACRRVVLAAWQWRSSRRLAAEAAQEAILRARNRAVRGGSVGEAAHGPRKPH